MAEEMQVADGADDAATIWQALDAWMHHLVPWQQYLVQVAVAHGRLTDAQVDEAFKRFLISRQLAESTGSDGGADPVTPTRPAAPLDSPLVLTRIDCVEGVNALPAGAALTFGPKLTVIYGRNGAGKSGFARIFCNACFSRQRPVILPDIDVEGDPPTPRATFHYTVGGEAQEPLAFGGGSDTAILRRITVFDSAVARHHITQTAAFEFRPAGFDVFPEVVRVYGLLSEKLDQEIERKSRQNDFPAAFLGGGTDVHDAVSALSETTDLGPLRALARYGPTESARLAEIEGQALALRVKSPKQAIATLREAKADVAALLLQLNALRGRFAGEAVAKRTNLIQKASTAVEAAKALGSDQFQRPFFNAIGSSEWETFVGSLHSLAHKEHEGYPAEGDPCLLCERPLDRPSTEHVRALLQFAEGDARRAAAAAQAETTAEAKALRALSLGHFSEATRVRTHVLRLSPALAGMLVGVFEQLEQARRTAIDGLENLTDGEAAVDVDEVVALLEALGNEIDRDIERLSADDTEAALASLESERRVLRHRHVLSQQLPAIEAYVAERAWVAKAIGAKPALNTRHVTDKEKELFSRFVTGGYRDRFTEECRQLDCGVPVELQTVGRSGQTLRSLAIRGGHKPDAVLSEGEQRAVALADFLTEVALNPTSAGIVLDDPVTSQDHERRQRIGDRLVAEARSRQVIVFTHDLVFLNGLLEAATIAAVPFECHWIQRDANGRPGEVAFGDAPATIRIHDTTTRAEKALADAGLLSGSARENAIRLGMGALRRTLEETVVRKLLKDAVPRWSDQVRVTTLRKVNWNNAKVEEIAALYEDLSRFIEGHSHTDEASGSPPEPADLRARIDKVNELIKWAKSDRPKP